MRMILLAAGAVAIVAHLALLGVIAWRLNDIFFEVSGSWRLLADIERNTCKARPDVRLGFRCETW